MIKKRTLSAGLLSCALVVGCGGSSNNNNQSGFTNDLTGLVQLLTTNADIAFAVYSDAVTTAQALKTALTTLAANQDAAALEAAKQAWLVAREPYGQSEVYRFRNSPIDDDPDTADAEDGPEGSLNAWPLGEALIDYVQATTSDFTDVEVGVSEHSVAGVNGGAAITAAYANANMADNIIGQAGVVIDNALLDTSASAGDEHDVISGYHAIEFLLWGQDLDTNAMETVGNNRQTAVKTHDAAARATGGERPVSDFNTSGGCTSGTGNAQADSVCQRRHDYLMVAVDKLIAELIFVRDHWDPNMAGNYRETFVNPADLATAMNSFLEILTGMGTMSEGELAGERMQISLSANSQEDEHSCFSDNTHRDIWLNAEGVSNMFHGQYAGFDSTLNGTDDMTANAVDGFGIDDYLAQLGADTLSADVSAALATTETNYMAIDTAARGDMPIDVVIQDATAAAAEAMRDTVVSLNAQSTQIARIATELGLGSAAEVVDPDASECDTTDPTSQC
ncbi:MAG: imelysin family protein [Pseudomonadota bacterium]